MTRPESSSNTPTIASVRRILLVGNRHRQEFSGPIAALESRGHVTALDTVAEALAWLAGDDERRPVIDEVVLVQARPGEILESEVLLLRRAAPLAKFTALLGSWCEGDARNGRPWPDVERRYWHSFTAAIDSPALPAALVGIYAWRLEDYEALAAALRPLARSGIWLNPRRLPELSALDVIVWDGRYGDERERTEIAAVRERYAGVPLVALLSFPRASGALPAKQAGITALLGKPYRLESLRSAVVSSLRSVV